MGKFTDLKGMPPEEFDKAVQNKISALKSDGHSNAYICERSFDIEEQVVEEWELNTPE